MRPPKPLRKGRPDGLCFPYVTSMLSVLPQGAKVVHGEIALPGGKVIDHAWVEHGGKVYDQQGTITPRQEFYRAFDPRPRATYTPPEALSHFRRTGHHGPWHRYGAGKGAK